MASLNLMSRASVGLFMSLFPWEKILNGILHNCGAGWDLERPWAKRARAVHQEFNCQGSID
jgi:hypothetical protein